jgi:ABC-type Mn2+/Zn2+ transport system ATPase subunit
LRLVAAVGFDAASMSRPQNDGVLLELDGVSAGYEGRAIVSNVSLRLRHGVFAGLLGANGSGKTTLLKTIAGILPPVTGRVSFCKSHAHPPLLGYVPQREAFDPIFLFSAREVVAMGRQRRSTRGESARMVENCLQRCGAADFAGRRFSELSGGQKQRVLIARALAAEPDFLLLDEPTAGIDAAASEGIGQLLHELHGQGMTVLMVNHELDVVRRLADEVIWLRRGEILHGPAAELLTTGRAAELLELRLG